MIVARTRLRKIPENCGKCPLSYNDWASGRMCGAKHRDCEYSRTAHGNWAFIRPNWCPLIEIKEEQK